MSLKIHPSVWKWCTNGFILYFCNNLFSFCHCSDNKTVLFQSYLMPNRQQSNGILDKAFGIRRPVIGSRHSNINAFQISVWGLRLGAHRPAMMASIKAWTKKRKQRQTVARWLATSQRNRRTLPTEEPFTAAARQPLNWSERQCNIYWRPN